jgi:hypothetical protein
VKKFKHEGHEEHKGDISYCLKALNLRDLGVISTALNESLCGEKG